MEQFNIEEYQKVFGRQKPFFITDAFGVKPSVASFEITEAQSPQQIFEFEIEESSFIEGEMIQTALGTAVVSPIKFEAGQYKKRLENGQIVISSYPEMILPYTSTIQVDLKKNIVRTALSGTGSGGTFKELINLDDAHIRIRGIAISEDQNKRPEQFIRQLKGLWLLRKELEVTCDYLTWLGISHLVIEDANFPAVNGQPGMQPFELKCYSDIPTELTFNDL